MTPKAKIVLGGAAALGLLLLLGGKAQAKGASAPVGTRARVVPNARGGVMTRTEPSARGGVATLISPEGTSPNDAYNSTTVTVLETGIKDADGVTGGEWWKIRTPGNGEGYARAVDPAGVHNFEVIAAPAVAGIGSADPWRYRPSRLRRRYV